MAFDDSDDDSDDGDLDSYRERMNNVKDSAGNGQPDMQMMQARAKRVQEKTNAALANSLRIAHETQAIGDSTLVELHRQGERLDGVSKKLDTIENDLSYSQKVLKVMRSPFGWIRNTKVKETEPRSDTMTSGSSSSSPLAKSKSKLPYDGNTSRGKEREDASWMYGNNDDEPGEDEDEDSRWSREMRNEFKAQDETLDEISGIMSNLKMQSNMMNDELERQKSSLDAVDEKVERDQVMLKDVNKKVGKMLGKGK